MTISTDRVRVGVRAFAMLVLTLATVGPAAAAPIECSDLPLDQLIATGSDGCTSSFFKLRFFDFSYAASATGGATAPAASDVIAMQSSVPRRIGWSFSPFKGGPPTGWSVGPGEMLSGDISYSVSGPTVVGVIVQTLTGIPGVSQSATVCVKDVFPCAGGTLIDASSGMLIPALDLASVRLAFDLDGRSLQDSTTLPFVSNVVVVNIPEPSAWLLLAIGIAVIVFTASSSRRQRGGSDRSHGTLNA